MAEEKKKLQYKLDALGNILDDRIKIPEYNLITHDDDMAVVKAKRKKQLELLEAAEKE
jgi:hypothetical protein